MTTNQNRTPAGQPAGGQFAPNGRTEDDLDLDDVNPDALAPSGLPHLVETLAIRRGHAFYPPAEQVAEIPAIYATDGIPAEDKFVRIKYFGPAGDWYITELDPKTGEAYGYASLAGMAEYAEWGYIDLPELERLTVGPFVAVERDLFFEVGTPFGKALRS